MQSPCTLRRHCWRDTLVPRRRRGHGGDRRGHLRDHFGHWPQDKGEVPQMYSRGGRPLRLYTSGAGGTQCNWCWNVWSKCSISFIICCGDWWLSLCISHSYLSSNFAWLLYKHHVSNSLIGRPITWKILLILFNRLYNKKVVLKQYNLGDVVKDLFYIVTM